MKGCVKRSRKKTGAARIKCATKRRDKELGASYITKRKKEVENIKVKRGEEERERGEKVTESNVQRGGKKKTEKELRISNNATNWNVKERREKIRRRRQETLRD